MQLKMGYTPSRFMADTDISPLIYLLIFTNMNYLKMKNSVGLVLIMGRMGKSIVQLFLL